MLFPRGHPEFFAERKNDRQCDSRPDRELVCAQRIRDGQGRGWGKVYQNEMARAVQELGYAIRQVRGNTRFWPVSKAGNTPATRAYRLSIRMAIRWDSAIPAPDPPPPCRCELFAFPNTLDNDYI